MAEETYFERIRARPFDAASARSRESVQNEIAPQGAFTQAQGEYVGRGLANIAKGVLGGPVDAVDSVIRKVGGGANAAIEALTGSTTGRAGPYGQGEKVFPDLESGRVLPDVPIGEEFALPAGIGRGISTFMTLYAPMVRALSVAGEVGWAGSMAAGAFADMMAFENKTGTLSDVLRGLGLDNQFTQALSGELAEDEWEASLRAAVEGAGLGMLSPAFKVLRAGLARWPQYAPQVLSRLGETKVTGTLATQRGSIGPDERAKPAAGQPAGRPAEEGAPQQHDAGRGRPGGGSSPAASGVFRRVAPGDAGLDLGRLGLTPAAVYRPDPGSAFRTTWAELGTEPANLTAFHGKLAERFAADTVGKQVAVLTPEDLAGHRPFLTDDGDAGFALSPAGEIVALFKAAGSARKGVTTEALALAIENGGTHLTAFNTYLPNLYARHGFKEVARMKFDRQFAPEGWNYAQLGEPDVVFMRYDPAAVGGRYAPGSTYVETYDEGLALARGEK